MKARIVGIASLLMGVGLVAAQAPSGLQISPPTFDFGWCPDNAKITAEFTVKNTGSDLVPLTSVQPTCGCTASQFTPEELSSQEETKIHLTFNTRGYINMRFNKSAKVKADEAHGEWMAGLTGFVLDPSAQVVPVGDGIAGFPPGSKEREKTIEIQNKSANEVSLSIVQPPAAWAKVKLKNATIAAGKTADMDISYDGSADEQRDTSVTLLARTAIDVNRLTIAIRTGAPPTPYKSYQPPKPVNTTPAKPAPEKK